MESWKVNLISVWFGCFFTGLAISQILPFLPLYVSQLGVTSHEALSMWSGLTFSVTFLVSAIVSPMWGSLADRKGRKLMLLRASLETALSAGLWNAGSLNGLTWGKTWPSAPLILLMLVSSALLVRRMRLLEMGDDTACALGVQVERSRLLLMLVAVVLTAASTALAGPISFIALVAPHIARRLSGTARWGLTQSALCGALLLALADYGAQRLFMPWQLPVGVLTVSLGGIYLIALLIQESRKK